MVTTFVISSHEVIKISLILLGFSLFYSSLEILTSNFIAYTDQLVSWSIMQNRSEIFTHRYFSEIFSFLMQKDVFKKIVVTRLILGLVIIITSCLNSFSFVAVFLGAITSIVLITRTHFGYDGSFQMQNMFLLVFAIILLFPNNIYIQTISFVFIALQICKAYFTSGFLKLISPIWRSGQGLLDALNSDTFGNKKFQNFIKDHLVIVLVITWVVILMEVLFPIGFILGGYSLYIFIFLALSFHVFVAIFMGLHRFVPVFFSTYPVLIYVRHLILWHFHLV